MFLRSSFQGGLTCALCSVKAIHYNVSAKLLARIEDTLFHQW